MKHEAFLKFKDINLGDYIIKLNWNIKTKTFPYSKQTIGHSGEFLEQRHANCSPDYKVFKNIFDENIQDNITTETNTEMSFGKDFEKTNVFSVIQNFTDNLIKEYLIKNYQLKNSEETSYQDFLNFSNNYLSFENKYEYYLSDVIKEFYNKVLKNNIFMYYSIYEDCKIKLEKHFINEFTNENFSFNTFFENNQLLVNQKINDIVAEHNNFYKSNVYFNNIKNNNDFYNNEVAQTILNEYFNNVKNSNENITAFNSNQYINFDSQSPEQQNNLFNNFFSESQKIIHNYMSNHYFNLNNENKSIIFIENLISKIFKNWKNENFSNNFFTNYSFKSDINKAIENLFIKTNTNVNQQKITNSLNTQNFFSTNNSEIINQVQNISNEIRDLTEINTKHISPSEYISNSIIQKSEESTNISIEEITQLENHLKSFTQNNQNVSTQNIMNLENKIENKHENLKNEVETEIKKQRDFLERFLNS